MDPQSLTRALENQPSKSTALNHALPIPFIEVNHQWTKVLRNKGRIAANEDVVCFAPRYKLGIESPLVDTMLRTLFPTLGNRARKATRYALQSALLSLLACEEYESPLELTTIWYCTDNGLKFQSNTARVQPYSRCVFTKVMKELAEHGYCERFKGFKAKSAFAGLPSLWRPTKTLLSMVNAENETFEVIKLPTYSLPIRVVEPKTKSKPQRPLDYERCDVIRMMEEDIEASNALRREQLWEYERPDGFGGTLKKAISPHDLEAHRLFHRDITQHGRFYLPAQQIRSAQRFTLTVNGQPTVEVDYTSQQPRILYNLYGLKAPNDCYEQKNRYSRSELKAAMLRALNCESRSDAVKSLMRGTGENHAYCVRLMEVLERQHEAVSKHFFKGKGRHLMKLDAAIASLVINQMTRKGVPMIPIHDSFIVEQKHAEELIDVMFDAYQLVLGDRYSSPLTVVGKEWTDSPTRAHSTDF